MRSTLYILLPLSLVLALVLVSQGVVQNFQPVRNGRRCVQPVAGRRRQTGHRSRRCRWGRPPRRLRSSNWAPTAADSSTSTRPIRLRIRRRCRTFLELLAILLISGGLCYTFGVMVGDTRQGWAVLAAMLVIFVPLMIVAVVAEQAGNPGLRRAGRRSAAPATAVGRQHGRQRNSLRHRQLGLWATATTAASNGSVNSMHDSFTPLGGLVPMWLMQLGEVIFGGVGSGLYGMLVFAIIAVFVAGLMVGRTPEYLGKKIEAFEMKMASLVILIPPLVVLGRHGDRRAGPGLHFTTDDRRSQEQLEQSRAPRLLAKCSTRSRSAGNNNGSAFAGLNANMPFYNTALGHRDADRAATG